MGAVPSPRMIPPPPSCKAPKYSANARSPTPPSPFGQKAAPPTKGKKLRPEGWPPTRWWNRSLQEQCPLQEQHPLQEQCPLWERCPCRSSTPCRSGALTANDFQPPKVQCSVGAAPSPRKGTAKRQRATRAKTRCKGRQTLSDHAFRRYDVCCRAPDAAGWEEILSAGQKPCAAGKDQEAGNRPVGAKPFVRASWRPDRGR